MMSKILEKFKQNEFKACGADVRPEYCIYPSNICCFSCDNNRKCSKLARTGIQPCKPFMPLIVDGRRERIRLFDDGEICEYAL